MTKIPPSSSSSSAITKNDDALIWVVGGHCVYNGQNMPAIETMAQSSPVTHTTVQRHGDLLNVSLLMG